MASPYIKHLYHIAQVDLPQLANDIPNAANQFTLQSAVMKMHNMLAILIHHAIHADAAASGAVQAQPAPAPVQPRPAPRPAAVAPSPSGMRMVGLPPVPGMIPIAGDPISEPQGTGSQVMEVTLTPSGTQVKLPGGHEPVAVLPPGAPVNLYPEPAPAQAAPMFALPAQAGAPMEVTLPRGGV